jgi:hypothetical protein
VFIAIILDFLYSNNITQNRKNEKKGVIGLNGGLIELKMGKCNSFWGEWHLKC